MELTRILVVEDEPITLQVLVENLRAEKFDTTGASCGMDAWEAILLAEPEFDLILLDRLLPDMDGIEILRRLKARAVRGPSVIMQTALSKESEIREGLREGAYYYLTKPFDHQALLAIVRAAARDRWVDRSLKLDVEQASSTMACMAMGRFQFQTPKQAWDLARTLAKATPDPDRSIGGRHTEDRGGVGDGVLIPKLSTLNKLPPANAFAN